MAVKKQILINDKLIMNETSDIKNNTNHSMNIVAMRNQLSL